jgi:hypothetical protein
LSFDVDLKAFQASQVENDPAVDDAVTRNAVPTTPHGKYELRVARKRDNSGDILRVCSLNDRNGPSITTSVEDGS